MLLGAGYTEPAGDLEFGTAGPTPGRKAGRLAALTTVIG